MDEVAPTGVHTEDLSAADTLRAVRGGLLFEAEEFDGNDRTCGTCHRALSNFDLTPQDVQQQFALNRHGPLFRSVDADVEGGNSYSLMRDDGLVRVHVVTAPNVTVDPGPGVSIRPDGRYVVALRRATPSVLNAAVQEHLMWDGREADDLVHQALSAAIDHAQVVHTPSARDLGDIAFFQEQLFTSSAIRDYAHGGSEPSLPEVPSSLHGSYANSLRHGRTFFVSGPLSGSDMAHRGLCATCHSGPMLNTTNMFNPGDPPGRHFAGNETADSNEAGLPTHTFHVALPYDLVMPPGLPFTIPPGTVLAHAGDPITYVSPDPGALIVDIDGDGMADPCPAPVACLLTVVGVLPQPPTIHRIPSLWGSANTAPYFHDNSAATFEEVVDHYRHVFFVETENSALATAAQLEATGDPAAIAQAAVLRDIAAALPISDQDRTDIANYMRYAFR